MLNRPRSQSLKIACKLLIVASVVGCAPLSDKLSDKYKAKDPNQSFEAAYQQHVEQKYGPQAGPNGRLKYYDDLLALSDDLIDRERKLDEERKIFLTKQKNTLDEVYASDRVEFAQFAAISKVHRKKLVELDQKKIELAKSPAKNQAKIEAINRQLDELSVQLEQRASEEANQQSRLKSQQQQLDKIQEELSAIAGRNYTLIADQRRQAVRNEIVHEQLLNADTAYLELKKTLLMGRASGDTLLDISELMLSTATTLSGGAMAKANLGAASTLLKGSRASIDKNFFAQQALAAIINAIEDRRQMDKLAIIKGLGRTTIDYPLQQALSDVRTYQNRANLMAGVLDLANQTANKVKESEKDLEDEKQGQEGKKNLQRDNN